MISRPLRKMPSPPRLYWGIAFALQVLTLGLFQLVWLVVQANWVRRVNGKSDAFLWSIANFLVIPSLVLLAVIEIAVGVPLNHPIFLFINLVSRVSPLITYVGTVFNLRNELENQPIKLSLSRLMTFFFGTVYFQFHLCEYPGRRYRRAVAPLQNAQSGEPLEVAENAIGEV